MKVNNTYFKKFKHGDLTKIHDPRLHLGHVTEVKYDSFECYAHFSQIRKFTRIAIICLLFMLHNTKKFQEILFHLFLLEKNKSAHSPACCLLRTVSLAWSACWDFFKTNENKRKLSRSAELLDFGLQIFFHSFNIWQKFFNNV